MIKNAIAWIRSIYWVPIFALIALAVSVVHLAQGAVLLAVYYVLVGVFLLLMRIGDK